MSYRQLIAIGTGAALLIASWLWTPTIWASPPEPTGHSGFCMVLSNSPFAGASKVEAVRVLVPIDMVIIAITAAAVYFTRSCHPRTEHSN